jgi:hypothetical protein
MECNSDSLGAFLVSWRSSEGILPLRIGAASTRIYIESERGADWCRQGKNNSLFGGVQSEYMSLRYLFSAVGCTPASKCLRDRTLFHLLTFESYVACWCAEICVLSVKHSKQILHPPSPCRSRRQRRPTALTTCCTAPTCSSLASLTWPWSAR